MTARRPIDTRAPALACVSLMFLLSPAAWAGCDFADSPMFCLDTEQPTPVETSLSAAATDAGSVLLRWTVGPHAGVEGFNVWRALSPDGPSDLINDAPLAPSTPSVFEDATVWPGTEFWYRLGALAGGNEVVLAGPVPVRTSGTLTFALGQASPNPSSRGTAITLDLARECARVRLEVHDISGRVVRVLVDGSRPGGRFIERWDGADASGRPVAAGVYFVRATAGTWTSARKVVLVR